jgi:hypothetical protein
MIDDPDFFRAAKRPNGQPATMKQCEQPSACEPKMLLTSAVGTYATSDPGEPGSGPRSLPDIGPPTWHVALGPKRIQAPMDYWGNARRIRCTSLFEGSRAIWPNNEPNVALPPFWPPM